MNRRLFDLRVRGLARKWRDYSRKASTMIWKPDLCSNVNDTEYEKRCLLRYIVAPFWTKNPYASTHQNQWQARELARIVGEFGYNVDAIGGDSRKVKLHGKYDLIVDYHPIRNPIYKEHLADSHVKIAYLTGSNPGFANSAELERLERLYKRRGVRLKQIRQKAPFEKDVLNSFDGVLFIGNDFNWRTYDEYKISTVCFIRNTGYSKLARFDCSRRDPKKFLFLGGNGAVHKGLDLLLEIFAENPDLELYVCSRFSYEKDFCDVYKNELFYTPNIHPVGFVDIFGPEAEALFANCAYIILPSCSEANAGSILVGMSAGLIPLVSRECGFEKEEVHFFAENSLDCIRNDVSLFSKRSVGWIRDESQRKKSIVQKRYSQSCYTESVYQGLKTILDNTASTSLKSGEIAIE